MYDLMSDENLSILEGKRGRIYTYYPPAYDVSIMTFPERSRRHLLHYGRRQNECELYDISLPGRCTDFFRNPDSNADPLLNVGNVKYTWINP